MFFILYTRLLEPTLNISAGAVRQRYLWPRGAVPGCKHARAVRTPPPPPRLRAGAARRPGPPPPRAAARGQQRR
eukprot:883824-Rhodomonas_salina.2